MAELEAEVSRLRDENEQLTTSYEALEEKFRPYMEQVDSLEDLNKLLQSQTSLAQSEAEKFGELYAKVLGHQNQKQKIQYVKKLRDENASLKQVCERDGERVRVGVGGREWSGVVLSPTVALQEIIVMRNEITKLKKTIRKLQLESSTPIASRKPLVSQN